MNIVSLFLVIHAIFFLPGLVHAQTQSAEGARLIGEAKKEGKVVVYAAYSSADANAFKAAFEKKYPFIRFEYFRAGKDKLLRNL